MSVCKFNDFWEGRWWALLSHNAAHVCNGGAAQSWKTSKGTVGGDETAPEIPSENEKWRIKTLDKCFPSLCCFQIYFASCIANEHVKHHISWENVATSKNSLKHHESTNFYSTFYIRVVFEFRFGSVYLFHSRPLEWTNTGLTTFRMAACHVGVETGPDIPRRRCSDGFILLKCPVKPLHQAAASWHWHSKIHKAISNVI